MRHSVSVGWRLGRSSWVIEATASINAPIDEVIGWWLHSDRHREMVDSQRSCFPDFTATVSSDGGARTTDMRWTSSVGQVTARSQVIPAGDGHVLRSGDRRLIRSTTTTRWRRSGRDLTRWCQKTTEFAPTHPGVTSVTSVHSHSVSNGPWWERYIPPVAERHHLRRELARTAARCERDAGRPAGGGPRPPMPPASRRRWRLPLGLALLIGLVAAISLATRSRPATSGTVLSPTFQTSWACQPPTPGMAQTGWLTVTGGTAPYKLTWMLNGLLDTSDRVTRTPTSDSGSEGFRYEMTLVPGSDTTTLTVHVTDSGNPPLSRTETLIGPPAACASRPQP